MPCAGPYRFKRAQLSSSRFRSFSTCLQSSTLAADIRWSVQGVIRDLYACFRLRAVREAAVGGWHANKVLVGVVVRHVSAGGAVAMD